MCEATRCKVQVAALASAHCYHLNETVVLHAVMQSQINIL